MFGFITYGADLPMGSRTVLLGLLAGLALLTFVLVSPSSSDSEQTRAGTTTTADEPGHEDRDNTQTGHLDESRLTLPDATPADSVTVNRAKSQPGKATLDIDVLGLPIHTTPWINVLGAVFATPHGTVHRRMEVDTSSSTGITISHTWDRSAPRFYFPRRSFRTLQLTPGEYRHVSIDFRTLVSVRGRLLGRHGTANVLISAQLETPPRTPASQPTRTYFSLGTNERGEFAIYGLPRGELSLFHHDAYPYTPVGPKLLDRSGKDRWIVPTTRALELETSEPLIGIRFVGIDAPSEKRVPAAPGLSRTTQILDSRRAIYGPRLESLKGHELQFYVAKIGLFKHRWRDLRINGQNELLVPVPTKDEQIGSLRIQSATDSGEARLESIQRSISPSSDWTLEVRSRATGTIHSLPHRTHRWRLPRLQAGAYQLIWKLGRHTTKSNITQLQVENWQNEVRVRQYRVWAGVETVVKLDPPKLVEVAIRIVNWNEIPLSQRPTHVLASNRATCALSAGGRASLPLPHPVDPGTRFELRREGIGGSIPVRVVGRSDGFELRYPLTIKTHRVRLRPRRGGTPVAWVLRVRDLPGQISTRVTESTPDQDGWLHFYSQGAPVGAWFVERIDLGSGKRAHVLRGWKVFAGKATDTLYDPGGRLVQFELEPGTISASIEMEIAGVPVTEHRRVRVHRVLSATSKVWIPDGAKTIRITVENGAPRTILVVNLTSPFVIGR